MAKLTKEYIQNHLETVHTYNSAARNLTEHLLRIASDQAGAKGIAVAKGDIGFEVRATSAGCVKVTLTIEWNGDKTTISYHVEVGPKSTSKK